MQRSERPASPLEAGRFASVPTWGVAPADTIVCVDCGGACTRLPFEAPELGWQVGDLVTYRCADCADMWYLEVDEDDVGEGRPGAGDAPSA